jgi:hypothetical protein
VKLNFQAFNRCRCNSGGQLNEIFRILTGLDVTLEGSEIKFSGF